MASEAKPHTREEMRQRCGAHTAEASVRCFPICCCDTLQPVLLERDEALGKLATAHHEAAQFEESYSVAKGELDEAQRSETKMRVAAETFREEWNANLAHVERYFADVLSAMESGHAIPMHDSDAVASEQGIPRELLWPKNLLVVGTVNADETTYPFSPKVLDRAFVLDVSRVEARAYLREARATAVASKPALPNFRPSRDWRALGVDRDDADFVLELHSVLQEAGRSRT